MAEQSRLRRLTRMDVLIAAAMGLLLIPLVPVLLAKPREQASRLVCAANLSQIGKAMFVYARDYEEELPRAGGPTSTWGQVTGWMAFDRNTAYGIDVNGMGGRASISSCFYLLVKYCEMPPRLFVCPADANTSEFKLSDLPRGVVPPNYELTDAWDFGPEPQRHCTYSYHMPFGPYALTTSRGPSLAVAADRSPWIASPAGPAQLFMLFKPDLQFFRGTEKQARAGNSITHQQDGQNVLFLDGRVTFEHRAYCGFGEAEPWGKDNIYTLSRLGQESPGDAWGTAPWGGNAQPVNRHDSLLVHDDPFWSGAQPTRR